MLMTKNNIFLRRGTIKIQNLSAGIVDQILVALKEDNAVEIPKRDRITFYVSDIARSFEKQKLNVHQILVTNITKGMERIKEKCYSDKVLQKISKLKMPIKIKNDTSHNTFQSFPFF